MARRSHTTTRARRTREAEQGIVALALLLFAALWRMSAGMNWRTLLVLGVFGMTIAIVVIRWVVQRQRRQARARLLLADAVSLTPLDFERRIHLLLADLGWERLAHVGGAGDGGVDLRGSFGGQHYIVQCKRYKGNVNPTHIRDLAGALEHEGADRALLVTTGRVSQQTRDWVTHKPIEIWDGDMLAQRFRQAEAAQRDPTHAARRRQQTQRFLAILAGVNILTILLAIGLPDPVASSSVARQQSSARERTTIAHSTPLPRIEAASAQLGVPSLRPHPAATATAMAVARVVNGGNVRTQPSMHGAVLDQLHARERVTLLARTGDTTWYQVSDARGVIGWVHGSLLRVDQAVAAQLPAAAP